MLLHDALGRLVWQQSISPETAHLQLDMRDGRFAEGVYWVSLWTEEGVVSKKLVLSRD